VRQRGGRIPRLKLDLSTLPQPDDTTCGPTCLHAVYGYWGIDIPLGELIAQVPSLPEGGTLAGMLACHALKRGLQATIYTYNLRLFDPTWFEPGVDLAAKLRAQAAAKPDVKLQHATATYLRFLSLGGQVRFAELNADLIHEHLRRQRPILTGLSATYLYGCAREREDDHDDIRGEPAGHFVILRGFDTENATVDVVDPLADNPLTDDHHYEVGVDRLIGAILLGVLSWDAVLLVLEPKRSP
jgi:hypothetical protein